MKINIKTPEEIEYMRAGGKILAETLDLLVSLVKQGISTFDLDKIAEDFILSHKAIPAFKGYHGFPATLCTSINNVIVHGIPKKNEILQEGDLLKIDCGLIYHGLYLDAARAVGVGKISEQRQKLITTSKEALQAGISKAQDGNKTSEIGKAIQKIVEENGFHVIYDLTGHGVGKNLHEQPIVFNYFNNKEDSILKAGMTIAIEPIFAISTSHMQTERDKWAITTVDGSDAVQFENTVLITKKGAEVLTKK